MGSRVADTHRTADPCLCNDKAGDARLASKVNQESEEQGLKTWLRKWRPKS